MVSANALQPSLKDLPGPLGNLGILSGNLSPGPPASWSALSRGPARQRGGREAQEESSGQPPVSAFFQAPSFFPVHFTQPWCQPLSTQISQGLAVSGCPMPSARAPSSSWSAWLI